MNHSSHTKATNTCSKCGARRAVTRRRARQACENCHSLKARCSGQLPSCQRCRHKGVECIYTPSRRRPGHEQAQEDLLGDACPLPERLGRSTSPEPSCQQGLHSTPSTFSAPATSLDHDFVMRIIDAFFHYIQPLPVYSFFHKVSLIQRYEAGLLDSGLMLAIVGLTCQFKDMGPGTRSYGAECLKRAESLIMRDIGRPSLIKIQALILIIRSHIDQHLYSKGFMLLALAARSAYALRLNHEAPKLCFLAQESRRRLMWSLFMIDTTLAGGMSDLALFPVESICVQLPCQDSNFELDVEQQTEPLIPLPGRPFSGSIGLVGLYVRVLWLRHRVLHTTKEAVLSGGDGLDQLSSKIEQLATELADFAASLPHSLRFTEKNLQLRAYSPSLCQFLKLHIWWRQCYCDLYRVVLTGLAEALSEDQVQRLDVDFVNSCRLRCYENSKALSDIFRSLKSLKGDGPLMEVDIHICAYQCARLLFHIYRYDGPGLDLSRAEIEDLAQQGLEAVEKIPHRSPATDSIKQDLKDLLQQGYSTGVSPGRRSSPVWEMSQGDTPQNADLSTVQRVFSRHGAVKQMNLVDDSEVFTMPTSNAYSQDHDSPATNVRNINRRSNMNTRHSQPQRRASNQAHPIAPDFMTNNAFQDAIDVVDFTFDPFSADPFDCFAGYRIYPDFTSTQDWNI